MPSSDTRVVAGRTLTFPVPVEAASISGAAFLSQAAVARRLIAAGPQSDVLDRTDVEVVTLPGGRTPVTVIHVKYHDVPGNVLGAYHEVGLAFQVRVPGVGTLQHIHELPVDQDFTLAAGNQLWGFPKWKGDMVGTAGGARDDARLGPVGSRGAGGVDLRLDTRVGIPVPGRHRVAMNCVEVLEGAPALVPAAAPVAGGAGGRPRRGRERAGGPRPGRRARPRAGRVGVRALRGRVPGARGPGLGGRLPRGDRLARGGLRGGAIGGGQPHGAAAVEHV